MKTWNHPKSDRSVRNRNDLFGISSGSRPKSNEIVGGRTKPSEMTQNRPKSDPPNDPKSNSIVWNQTEGSKITRNQTNHIQGLFPNLSLLPSSISFSVSCTEFTIFSSSSQTWFRKKNVVKNWLQDYSRSVDWKPKRHAKQTSMLRCALYRIAT